MKRKLLTSFLLSLTTLFGVYAQSCNATANLYSDSINCLTMYYNVTGGPYSNVWWDFGDGNTATNSTSGSHTYAASGTYNVEVVVYSYDSLGNYQCGDTINQSFTINCTTPPSINCNASLYLYSDSSDCHSLNYSVGGGPYTNTWWDFGDGNTTANVQSGTHTYAANGTYNVEVVVYNYDSLGNYICGDTVSQLYTVYCQPAGNNCNATMYLYDDSINCQTMYYNITGGPYTNTWWDFGDGNTAYNVQSGTHTYAANGTYNVEVVVYNYDSLGNYICGDTVSQLYTVYCQPAGNNCNATMYLYDDSINCQTMYYNITGGPYTNTWWDFGDGNTATNVQSGTHTYATNGTYNVEVVVYNYDSLGNYICGDTVSQSFTVNCVVGVEENVLNIETSVYPNPVQSGGDINVVINAQSSSSASVELISLIGQAVAQNSLDVFGGENKLTIPTYGLPSGIYLVRVTSEGGAMDTKRVIIK